MRRATLAPLIVVLLWGVAGLRWAQADSTQKMKPIVVMSLAGYEELRGDVAMVGNLAGRPELADNLEGLLELFTQGKGLAGVDKKKPWGAVIQTDGSTISGYAFLPVTSLDEFGSVMKPLVEEIEELGEGVYKVKNKGTTVYVKHKQGGWLVACENPEALAATPDDPGQVLGDLPQRYDVAIRISASNVPEQHGEKFLAKLKDKAAKDLEQRPGEDELEFAIRKHLGERLLQAISTVAEDLDQLTVGWSLDHRARKALLELDVAVKPGSKTAQAFAETAEAKTEFAGFCLPRAALAGSGVAVCPHVDPQDLSELFDLIRDKAAQDIEAEGKPEEETKATKQLADGLLTALEKTIASGRADGGTALLLKPDSATLIVGRYVADGRALEDTLDDLVEAVRRKHPDFVARVLKTEIDQHDDIHFHRLSLPIPEDAKNREKLVQLVGEMLEVIVGCGDRSVYLGAGKDALKTLKRAIARSESPGARADSRLQVSLKLSEIARFAAAMGDGRQKRRAEKALAVLEKSPGKDRVVLTAVPTDHGTTVRLEIEPGVLKMLGAAAKR